MTVRESFRQWSPPNTRFAQTGPVEIVTEGDETLHVHRLIAVTSAEGCRFHWEPTEDEMAEIDRWIRSLNVRKR